MKTLFSLWWSGDEERKKLYSLTCRWVSRWFPDSGGWAGAWRGWDGGWRAQTLEDCWARCPGTEGSHLRVVRVHPEERSSSQGWSGYKEESGQGWGRHSRTSLPGSPQWQPLQTPGCLRGTCRRGGHAVEARDAAGRWSPALRRLGWSWVWLLVHRAACCSVSGSAWATSQHNSTDMQHDLDFHSHLLGGGSEEECSPPSPFTLSSLSLSLSNFLCFFSPGNLKGPLFFQSLSPICLELPFAMLQEEHPQRLLPTSLNVFFLIFFL